MGEDTLFNFEYLSYSNKIVGINVSGTAEPQEWTYTEESGLIRAYGRANFPVENVPQTDIGFSEELINSYNEANKGE